VRQETPRQPAAVMLAGPAREISMRPPANARGWENRADRNLVMGGLPVPAADPFDLTRFVSAQANTFGNALAELRAKRKRTHWMWFVFPQIRGLGRSETSRHFGIGSLLEARAYLAHPVLAQRLAEATHAVLAIKDRSLVDIFGSPDDLKFCSSMTLFAEASDAPHSPYAAALVQFCDGQPDSATLDLLPDRSSPGG
jgi:uncharacterized protein (DUF1810 family)